MGERARGQRVGVDTGGTFTDFVVPGESTWSAFKLLSTPDDPARAVLAGLSEVPGTPSVVHGTTVATNATLEGNAARVAFVTTGGFEDLLLLGRQARPSLYDLDQAPRPTLVRGEDCHGIPERVAADGSIEVPLDLEAVDALRDELAASGTEAVAVCLLFSFLEPRHERALARALAPLDLPLSISSEVLPQHREFERAVATVRNVALIPIMEGYLQRLEKGLSGRDLAIMQSSGGSITPSHARRFPVLTLLSGPAGGVVAGAWASKAAQAPRIITFDMGGTSTDVATYEGALPMTREGEMAGHPLAVPMLDIHTVGAGGGSIAYRDAGGALRVGPRSAGAAPGPACYGRGTEPTVTDAHLCLGWLDPDHIAGGRVKASPEMALRSMEELARRLSLEPLELAEGIVRVAEANMAGALRRITTQRGKDPRHFSLLSFGGGGPLHACSLARELGIPQVIIPPLPGAFSAFGMVCADTVRQTSRGLLRRGRQVTEAAIQAALLEMSRENRRELLGDPDALPPEETGECLTELPELELRYRGQSYEIAVPYSNLDETVARFHEEHDRLHGHCDPSSPVETVSARLRTALSRSDGPDPQSFGSATCLGAGDSLIDRRKIYWNGWHEASFHDRRLLTPATPITGPAVILEDTSTTLIPPSFTVRLHPSGCLILTPA